MLKDSLIELAAASAELGLGSLLELGLPLFLLGAGFLTWNELRDRHHQLRVVMQAIAAFLRRRGARSDE